MADRDIKKETLTLINEKKTKARDIFLAALQSKSLEGLVQAVAQYKRFKEIEDEIDDLLASLFGIEKPIKSKPVKA